MDTTPTRTQPSPERRDGRLALVALAIAIAFLVAAAAIVVVVVTDVIDCSPPSRRELDRQEAFVRSHLADARDIRSDVGDCDAGGRGYVNFTTSLSPAEARDVFLADTSCSSVEGSDGDDLVRCRSGRTTVVVFLTANARDDTAAGELDFK